MSDGFLSTLGLFCRNNERRPNVAASLRDGVLREVFTSAAFRLVDIGARGGPMPQLVPLAPFSHYYACEPDTKEIQTLASRLKETASWQGITLMPEAISSLEGPATLYLTKQPGLSSLLKPNDAIVNRYYRTDEFRILSTISIPTIRLDDAAERYGFRDASFLKLDTQGSELDILKSGRELLQQGGLVGLYVEVEFHPFYTGQPLFSEVDGYLQSFGFSLFNLQRSFIRRASYRENLYSQRQIVWGHALYLREPEILLKLCDETLLVSISRLLGLALAFEYYDLALELVTSGRSAALFGEAYGSRVHTAVEEFVVEATKKALKKTKSRRRTGLTAFGYKDRDRI
jgi:FkbM family methyltransferase